MSFEKEHIDKIIKSKMDNFEIVPDDASWDNLEKALLKNKTNIIRNRIGGAVALILGLLIAWFLYHTNTLKELNNKNIDLVDSIHQIKRDSIVIHESTSAVKLKNNNKISIEQNQSAVELQSTNQEVQDSVDNVNVHAVVLVDTVAQKTTPVEKVVVKKVIKKPVYVVQQDTIFKVDTLSKKKKR